MKHFSKNHFSMNLGVGKPTIPSPSKEGSIKPPQFIFKTKPKEKKK